MRRTKMKCNLRTAFLCFIACIPQEIQSSENECTIYLAESSIPGAGLGVFTTRKIEEDELVGEPDVTILFSDVTLHQVHLDDEYPEWIHNKYFWEASDPVEYFFSQVTEVQSFPIGSMTNFHTYLYNVEYETPRYQYDLFDRNKDPGAGAVSYFVERNFTADRIILPGEEIFSHYGEEWLTDHGISDVPMKKNFDTLQTILETIPKHIKRNEKEEYDSGLLKLLKDVVQIYDEKTANMLPETDEDLRQIAFHGIGWNTITKRTPEWVKDNGQCIDQLRAGKSTIEQAGRGAFAKYFIAKGGLVAPLPFLQILNKDELNMYKTKMHEGTNIKYADYDKLVGQQLILNYCFTHNESTLLLCPVSLAALINHKSTRSQNADGPNAHYRWSQWEKSTSEWLDLSFGEIGEKNGRGLSFEIIALRDIHPGEEIFIDYGIEWETAWQKHVDNWKPPSDAFFGSVSPEEMNLKQSEIRTNKELVTNPYPPNIMTACLFFDDDNEADDKDEDEDFFDEDDDDIFEDRVHWSEASLEEQLEWHSISGDKFDFSDESAFGYWPCRVYEKNNERDKFTVRIFQSPHAPSTSWTRRREPMYVRDLPRHAITFFERPHRSDAFLPEAFRHPIIIDDNIFPNHWKNLKDEL